MNDLTVVDKKEKQISQLYLLLLEGNCEVEKFNQLKNTVKKLWKENNKSLDTWFLYFIVLQKEKNIICELNDEDSFAYYLLSKINDAINDKDYSLVVGEKTKEEIKEYIYNCLYDEVEKNFNSIFYGRHCSLNFFPSINKQEKLRNTSRIINNFDKVFAIEQKEKENILQRILKSAQKRQKEINEKGLFLFKWGEKKYNQCLNYYLSIFFKDINYSNKFPFIAFNFKKNFFRWAIQEDRWVLNLAYISGIASFLSFAFFPHPSSDWLLLGQILLAYLGVAIPILTDGIDFSSGYLEWRKNIKKRKTSYLNNNFNPSIDTNNLANQSLEVLQTIPTNDIVIDLADQIKRYQDLSGSFDKTNTPSVLLSLNIYLTPFLKNIIKEKDKLSKNDILASIEAFKSANDSLNRLKKTRETLAIEAKKIEFDIAKQELDAINSQLNLEKKYNFRK